MHLFSAFIQCTRSMHSFNAYSVCFAISQAFGHILRLSFQIILKVGECGVSFTCYCIAVCKYVVVIKNRHVVCML